MRGKSSARVPLAAFLISTILGSIFVLHAAPVLANRTADDDGVGGFLVDGSPGRSWTETRRATTG